MRIVTILTLYLSLATKALNPSTNIAENVAHLSLGPGRNLIIVKRKLAIMGISSLQVCSSWHSTAPTTDNRTTFQYILTS